MNYLFLNLKRFDIPPQYGGVNRIAPIQEWGRYVIAKTQKRLMPYCKDGIFVQFFPEAHLLSAAEELCENSPIALGCQGVHRVDTAIGGNFGALTTHFPASAAAAMGCRWAMIGHYEERKDKADILAHAAPAPAEAVNRILNQEIQAAAKRGLKILYCIGETEQEQSCWKETLAVQLKQGLQKIDLKQVCIAYEPVWAIGPGKLPPDQSHIQMVVKYIKEYTGGVPVVYGGGLKADNAESIAAIPEVDGGLIALTRFGGEIGFYPDEYIAIVEKYLARRKNEAAPI